MDYTLDKKLLGFKQIAQEKLQAILCSIPSPKDLIIEPSLIKPLEHVCVASWVKSKGVQRIYKFDQKHSPPKQTATQVFFISANLLIFKHVLDQIHAYESEVPSDPTSGIKSYHIIVMPAVFSCFHNLLEEEGLYGQVQLHKFSWDFILLDDSVLSLEIPQLFSEVFIKRDTSALSSVAHSLRLMQTITGAPDVVLSYGEQSEKILEMVHRLNNGNRSGKIQDFSAMIVMDRDKDYPSCLLTPAIYSGLLLEVFKCRAGELETQSTENKISAGKLKILKVPPTKGEQLKTKQTTNIRMNGKHDEIFGENRYKHFSEASNLVRAQAKALGVEVQNINKMKINEMQQYVTQKLPKITEMKNKILRHLNVCEEIVLELAGGFQRQQSLEEDILNNVNKKQIITKIDEILTVDGHKYNTIRLICLVYLSMGLSSDELATFVRNYCNVFGHRHLYIFQALTKAGLLPEMELNAKNKLLSNLPIPKFQQTDFQVNAGRMKLLPSDSDRAGNAGDLPKLCPSYVFNGTFIPVISQLALSLLKAENADDLYSKLGLVEKILLKTPDSDDPKSLKQIQLAVKKGELPDRFPIKKRTLLIFILGGITYAEISACDMIGRLTGSKIVVASNCICSGSELISAAF